MSGKRTNKKEKSNKDKKKKSHKKLKKVILTIFLILLVLGVICAGILFGVLFGLIKGEWSLSEEDLQIAYANSTIVDLDGNVISTLNGDENRIIISMEDMSDYLPQAFISIEDERFETHYGVDLKRTLGATLTFLTNNGSSSYGGSTITQQCIKNLTGEDDSTGINGVLRKVKEMARAIQLEQIWSKDQIMELYLNLIPLGGGGKNICGVEMASIYYFNKSAKDLTVVEAAYLAGITNAPNTYNPFGDYPYGENEDKTEKINKRVTDVLYKMNQLGRLSNEEYQAALAEIDTGLKFEQGNTSTNTNQTYHTEAAINQITNELMEKYNWTEKEAKIHIYGGGYTIYTTQDTDLQETVEEAYTNKDWITYATYKSKDAEGNTTSTKEQIQSAMVIIDHSTGYVVAGAGALGEKTVWGTNRMTETGHQPGSSIKPIAVIGPSLQEGIITAASVFEDTPVSYGSWSPKNDSSGYRGLMNIRWILRVSRNIPEVKIMNELTVSKSIEYLESLGVTSLSGQEGLSLALGGASNGISPLEMAGAYATIANNGVYIEPTFYTKVEDSSGNVILEKEQETHRVFSEQNAWILQSLLTEPTGTGLTGSSGATATGAALKGYQTCGKTGTTNDSTFTWFCGFTPYYTATMYFGYDHQGIGKAPGSGTVARRWASIMKIAHQGLTSASFEQPSGITTAKVCSKSGLLATSLCSEAGCAYTEYFVSGTVPKDYCDTHITAEVCEDSGLLATEDCPNTVTKVFISRESRDSGWESADDAGLVIPTEYCDHASLEHETPSETDPSTDPTSPGTTTPPAAPSDGEEGDGSGDTGSTGGDGNSDDDGGGDVEIPENNTGE